MQIWQKYKLQILASIPVIIVVTGMLLPAKVIIPVEDATRHDWNHQTFWDNRWGRSGVHKGIDIFANVNRPVVAATSGIIIFKGQRLLGGNTIAILGPKWRIHYYAHLNEIKVGWLDFVSQKEVVATVGKTGNARNKPAHLHYSILSLVPHPWRWDNSMQGWKKTFFLDPTVELLPRHRIKLAKNSSKKKHSKKLARNMY